MNALSQAVLDRALNERGNQLRAGVSPERLAPIEVTEKEWKAWVGDFHAPYAVGVPLRLAF